MDTLTHPQRTLNSYLTKSGEFFDVILSAQLRPGRCGQRGGGRRGNVSLPPHQRHKTDSRNFTPPAQTEFSIGTKQFFQTSKDIYLVHF